MNNLRTIDLQDMRSKLPEFAATVDRTGEPFLISRDGKAVAVLIGFVHYHMLVGAFFVHRDVLLDGDKRGRAARMIE